MIDTKNELNKKIVSTMAKIQEDYPGLAKHLDEIPVHFLPHNNEGVNEQDLKNYLDSLTDLYETYSEEHQDSPDSPDKS